MKKIKITALAFIIGIFVIASCKDDGPSDTDCSTVKYSTTLAPLIASKCAVAGCHDSGSVNGDYTTYALMKPNLDSGKVRTEVLVDKTMPKGTVTLTDAEIENFKCWLDDGHPDN